MGNMLSYIKEYGHLSFEEKPFCEVDSLVLAQISYFVFDGYVSGRHRFKATLREIVCAADDAMALDTTLPKDNKQLFDALKSCRRFGAVQPACYQSVTDTESELQFAAVTFRLLPRLHYIAFRGTDTSLVGWKEDFNLAYSENIPSQQRAALYLRRTARYLRGTLILGGHSKGGHLAMYAAMHASCGLDKRIAAVYNHDGPGFLPQVYESEGFKRIEARVHKTVPQGAIVGMLLGNYGRYTVVDSKYFALVQHNPFTWEVEKDRFVRLKQVDFLSTLTDKTLQAWMTQLDVQTRKKFVDAVFDILSVTGAQTYPELIDALKRDITPMRDKLKDMDPETRKMMRVVLRSFVKIGAAQLKLLLKSRTEGRS